MQYQVTNKPAYKPSYTEAPLAYYKHHSIYNKTVTLIAAFDNKLALGIVYYSIRGLSSTVTRSAICSHHD